MNCQPNQRKERNMPLAENRCTIHARHNAGCLICARAKRDSQHSCGFHEELCVGCCRPVSVRDGEHPCFVNCLDCEARYRGNDREKHDEDGSLIMVCVAAVCFLLGWLWGTLEQLWRKAR